jgi:hypothetical protein
MHTPNQLDSKVRRILGLAMIAVGIFCAAAQFAEGATQADAPLASPAVAPSASETPRVENARLETRAVSGSLDSTFRELAAQAEKPEWIGYSVDQIAGDHNGCCDDWSNGGRCGTCFLEKEHALTSNTSHSAETVRLEGTQQLVVLFRLEAKQVNRIRVASANCVLNAADCPSFG